MTKLLLMLIALASCAIAQEPKGIYTITKKTTLSAAAEVITLQQPASGSKLVVVNFFTVSCSDECEVTVERDGTAASTAALGVNKVDTKYPAPTVTAWSGSDAGVGTVLYRFVVPPGGTFGFDPGVRLAGDGTGKNFTLRTSSFTGTAIVNVKTSEY